ncbi:MAG TPA: family 2 encapsulin nanocompartment cargo protein polyprenyl transferase [Actinophytocola sp.]|uniref:family 2 encapsulin nanocompartment cargo protein polyprenyl transferase n=1 Tax=Actinophytocola sp. TaxID=1872138 RepID=UPI002DB7E8DE|nr:family 2 encapsulin nanocompartment cargo protein polyprenyl transferase [Actinophytocola sp.]HEU5473442.1 family 2 encapsulin nanocompartment cargo protein polyprenyl transferase [Actinophytocola sp.]
MTTLEGAAARPAAEVLAACRAMVSPALRSAVDTLPSTARHLAGYHFGWWDQHGAPTPAHGGKALRPALVLLAAEAVAGPPVAAVPAAVAVELVHNFSLVHDDVMDRDRIRRHRPTVWATFGMSAAILAGDALLTLALDVLAASGHPAARTGLRMLAGAVQDLVAGQCADVDFEQRHSVGRAECEAMSARKTGALLGCAAGLGALYGGGTPDRVDRLRAFGAHLGLAFQHVDDLLGIWGDPAVTGKPVHSDLRAAKKTLPVVAALTSGTRPGEELVELYRSGPPLPEAELARAADLVDRAGGRSYSRNEAAIHLDRALHELVTAVPASRAVADLSSLGRHVTRRDH